MSDSTNPLYQKGYRAGRRKTEAEVAATRRKNTYAEEWNRLYASLLPVAMTVENWQIGGQPVRSTEDRIKVAKLWADKAAENLK